MKNGYKLPYRGGYKFTEEERKVLSDAMKLRHKKYKHPMLGRKQTEKCIESAKIRSAGKNNVMYGKHHTEKTCKQISDTRKRRKIPGTIHTEEVKKFLRIKRIKEIETDRFSGNQVMPSFNKKSCLFFDILEKELGWDGKYATKNGEHQIKELGYFLDYYEPTKNLVIEWDERRHYIGEILKNKDVIRQKQIEDFLKCKFIRINEKKFDERIFLTEMKQYD